HAKKFGKFGPKKIQRYRCLQCGKTFSDEQRKPLDEMRIPMEKAVFALNCLVEGCSVRSTKRLTGLHRDTILNLVVLVGQRCERLFEEKIQGIKAKHVQADEIWGYVGKKEKRKKSTDGDKLGDAY